MRKLIFCLVVPAILALPYPAVAGELKLTMNAGLVTLIADDVPLSTVLAEWARLGKTKIVNGEQIFTRVTLHLVDTPERKALDILLRSAAGYIAAERPTAMAGASAFDRIMILPTSRPPANSGPIVTAPPPAFAPRPAAPPVPDVDDDPPGAMPPGMGPQGMPMNAPAPMNTPGMMNTPGPMNMPGAPGQPQAPLTSPRPGMLPPPAQQPVPFGAPPPAPRPPGSGGGPGGGSGGSGGGQI